MVEKREMADKNPSLLTFARDSSIFVWASPVLPGFHFCFHPFFYSPGQQKRIILHSTAANANEFFSFHFAAFAIRARMSGWGRGVRVYGYLHWVQGIAARGGHKARSVTPLSTVVGCQRISFFVVEPRSPSPRTILNPKCRPPSATTHSGVALTSGVRGEGGGLLEAGVFQKRTWGHTTALIVLSQSLRKCFELMFCI